MLTPLDVQNKEFRRALRGYNEEEVDEFLDQLAQDYEWIYMENERLKEKLEDIESGIKRYEEMEQTIKDTLVMAQKNSDELRENTQKETEVMVNEARQKAQQTVKDAEEKADKIISMAEEKAEEITEDAKQKVESTLQEYQWLQRQAKVFRVKFRSFLEAQLNLMEKQEKEILEPQQEIASAYYYEDPGASEQTDNLPEEPEKEDSSQQLE
ncbi:MAG: DivIVA domain-containing protein [Clostridiales bacterium]|nr:DivIVA domain-containing protein [Clostridiales bacterium]MCF8021334.1 DivIVA domain-containing protein [Clostridiales bacterium]